MSEKKSKMATTIFYEPYFLYLGLYVCDLLENCTIFGTTIFLDWRENAPIGENGFEHILKTILSFSLSYSRFLNIEV